MSAGMLADVEGQALVAAIHTRKRLTEELAAADDAWDKAVREAAGLANQPGELHAWSHARQAGEVVRQCRAAVKAAGEEA